MALGRNDKCWCGSNKKYKDCCYNTDHLFISDEVKKDFKRNESIYERNMILLEAIIDIFQMNKKGRTWEEIKRKISDHQVKELYKVIASIWPPETNIYDLLPEPNNRLRALYLGDSNPDLLIKNVFRFGLYSDEILIIDPFINPSFTSKEYNPIEKPTQYYVETLKLVYFMILLEPWVSAKIVSVIPNPGMFNSELRKKTLDLASIRLKNFKIEKSDLDYEEEMAKSALLHYMYTLPEPQKIQSIKNALPNISDVELQAMLKRVEQFRKNDPYAVDRTLGIENGQITRTTFGANLEMGIYISQLTGSFPFTPSASMYKQILQSQAGNEIINAWSPLTKAFQELDFKFLDNVPSEFAIKIREDGRLYSFRSFIRKLWNTNKEELTISKVENLSRDFIDELHHEYSIAKDEWNSIDSSLVKWFTSTTGGAIAGGILSGRFDVAFLGLGFAGVAELISSYAKRKTFRSKVPMSVFVDLSKQTKIF